MSRQYLLNCQCGQQLRVEARQAGDSLACSCGKTLRVPTLRQLQQLPTADDADLRRPPSVSWTRSQGITFVVGVVVATAAMCFLAYSGVQRYRLVAYPTVFDRIMDTEDFRTLSVDETWIAWQTYRDIGIAWGHTRQYEEARQQAFTLNAYIGVSAAASLCGIACILTAIFYSPSRRERPTSHGRGGPD